MAKSWRNNRSFIKKRFNYSTGIHFSNLFVQSQNRCLNFNPKYEKARYNVQIKWYSLFDDIIENLYYKNNERKISTSIWLREIKKSIS